MKRLILSCAAASLLFGGCETLYEIVDETLSDPVVAKTLVVSAAALSDDPEVSNALLNAAASADVQNSKTETVVPYGKETTPAVRAPAPTKGDQVINQKYSFTCSSGTKATVPIVTDSAACAEALKFFAKSYSCNIVENFESALKRRQKECGW